MHSFLSRRKIGKKVERARGEDRAVRGGQISTSGKGKQRIVDRLDDLE